MKKREIGQAIRHIAEKLANGGSAQEAVEELHELAEELDPGGFDDLTAYTEAES